MDPMNGKLTEGYTIVRFPGRQLCSLDTRLLTSIFAASEAFVEKEGKTSGVGKERKSGLEHFSPR